jgi:hypothetical protein
VAHYSFGVPVFGIFFSCRSEIHKSAVRASSSSTLNRSTAGTNGHENRNQHPSGRNPSKKPSNLPLTPLNGDAYRLNASFDSTLSSRLDADDQTGEFLFFPRKCSFPGPQLFFVFDNCRVRDGLLPSAGKLRLITETFPSNNTFHWWAFRSLAGTLEEAGPGPVCGPCTFLSWTDAKEMSQQLLFISFNKNTLSETKMSSRFGLLQATGLYLP